MNRNMAAQKRSEIFGAVVLTLLFWLQDAACSNSEVKTLRLLMPDVQPRQNDSYLCTAFKMPQNDFEYIVEFQPYASMERIHHIVILTCGFPGRYERDNPQLVWDCGFGIHSSSGYTHGSECERRHSIIYAWALGAPTLKLPEGVGFKVGKGSKINYLVLNVHYANVNPFLNGATDNSGVILSLLPSNTRKITKYAGVYYAGALGRIPAKSEVHMEAACEIKPAAEIHPFAFRTHTHTLGKVVSGYKIDEEGKWHLIGKHNPREPQAFYPVKDENLVIRKNDILAVRCTTYNFRSRETKFGPTNDDEMCVFYMMYYVDDDELPSNYYCFSSGPPSYYWKLDNRIGYVPPSVDISASQLD